ncbi:MAG: hypothetical protein HC868_15285 [Sphingomonadales bacterium]|nr:hypothetical protein [Sphingomonadales bacterium]
MENQRALAWRYRIKRRLPALRTFGNVAGTGDRASNSLGTEPHGQPVNAGGQRGAVLLGGGIGDAMGRLGAVLSTVPATEVYTAIERGTVDAVSFPYTYAHVAYQIHTVANWYTSNMSPGTTECASVINKDALAKLPPQYKQLLDGAKEPAYAALIKAYVDIDKVNEPMFKAKLTEIVYTDAELKKFQETVGRPVWDKWVADNKGKFDAQNVLDTLLREIEKARAKHLKK